MLLWFSTAAGYAARIILRTMPPATALVPFICASSGFFRLEITLGQRAARRHAERQRKEAV